MKTWDEEVRKTNDLNTDIVFNDPKHLVTLKDENAKRKYLNLNASSFDEQIRIMKERKAQSKLNAVKIVEVESAVELTTSAEIEKLIDNPE